MRFGSLIVRGAPSTSGQLERLCTRTTSGPAPRAAYFGHLLIGFWNWFVGGWDHHTKYDGKHFLKPPTRKWGEPCDEECSQQFSCSFPAHPQGSSKPSPATAVLLNSHPQKEPSRATWFQSSFFHLFNYIYTYITIYQYLSENNNKYIHLLIWSMIINVNINNILLMYMKKSPHPALWNPQTMSIRQGVTQ